MRPDQLHGYHAAHVNDRLPWWAYGIVGAIAMPALAAVMFLFISAVSWASVIVMTVLLCASGWCFGLAAYHSRKRP